MKERRMENGSTQGPDRAQRQRWDRAGARAAMPKAAAEEVDDELVGRLLSRRDVLLLTGGVGAAAFIAACGYGATTANSLVSTGSANGPSGAAPSSGGSIAAASAAS